MKANRTRTATKYLLALLLSFFSVPAGAQSPSSASVEFMKLEGEIGRPGGRLVLALRSEPKTLNPVTAADGPSREVIWRMMADLVHINRFSQKTEPALAKTWKMSP